MSHTRKISLSLVFAFAVLLGACVGAGQTTGEFVDDSVITTKVKTRLVEDMALKGFSIKTNTTNGVVELSGTVESAAQKQRAEEVVRTVNGVKGIKNDIVVK